MSTPEQAMSALDRANRIRCARADLRRRITNREVFAASVLLDPPEETLNWPVGDLLTAQPRWGPARMRRLLGRLGIRETRTLGELTERQTDVLAHALSRLPR